MHTAPGPAPRGRRGRRKPGAMNLNIISLIDIFTVLVFFLLLNLTQTQSLPETDGIRLPESSAQADTRQDVVVMVSRERILLQGEPVASVAEAMSSTEPTIAALRSALRALPAAPAASAPHADGTPPARELTVMGDREIPYQLLRKVLATCAETGFGAISLAVLQKATPRAGTTAGTPVASVSR